MLWRTVLLLPLISGIDAFSFSFDERPTQCSSLTVTVNGGTPPYRLLMVPSGPLPGIEIRTIIDKQFNSSSFTLPPLAFPGQSNFTAVMSDATGIGTGGTSVITDVNNSGDSSCLATSPTSPLFYLELPNNPALFQCGFLQVTFSNSAQGQATLIGIIPGGQSFSIPVPNGARTVNWYPISVPAGTGVMLVAGDDRGLGTGGSAFIMIVQNGSGACLNAGSPVYSSTPAPYAGGQYATGSGGGTVTGPWQNSPSNGSSSSSSSSSKGSKVGIIVGVVCGVVALLVLLLIGFILYRRRRARNPQYVGTKEVKDRSVHVAGAGPDNQHLEPTPFYAPDNNSNSNANSTHRPSTSIGSGYNVDRHSMTPLVPPSSWNPNAVYNRSTTPSGRSGYEGTEYTSNGHSWSDHTPVSVPASSTAAVGSGMGRQEMTKHVEGPSRLRPLNVIQHADGGTVPITETGPQAAENDVVELPPSYNDVRKADVTNTTSP